MVAPEEPFEQLLGLGESWRVLRTEYEPEHHTFVICVEETPKLWDEQSARWGPSEEPVTYMSPFSPVLGPPPPITSGVIPASSMRMAVACRNGCGEIR